MQSVIHNVHYYDSHFTIYTHTFRLIQARQIVMMLIQHLARGVLMMYISPEAIKLDLTGVILGKAVRPWSDVPWHCSEVKENDTAL